MRDDLIERLRAVKWEVTDDCGRMPDDPTHKCVFVDMRPDDFRALLRESADALEAAREDAERWRALRELDGGEIYALLGDCDGIHPEQADAAIDQALGKGGQEVSDG